MTIIEKIKAEIERRIALYSLWSENTVNPNRIDEDRQLLSFISTLESEKPRDLGERIGSYNIVPYIEDKIAKLQDAWREEKVSFDWDDLKDMTEDVARHFAEWGAEHLADNKVVALKLGDEIAINGYKLVYDKNENAIRVAKVEPNGSSEDLEEAAEEYEKKHTYQRYDGGGLTPEYNATLAEAVIFGAKWQKEQMMKEAVEAEGRVVRDINNELAVTAKNVNLDKFKFGDKVRVIVLPMED